MGDSYGNYDDCFTDGEASSHYYIALELKKFIDELDNE